VARSSGRQTAMRRGPALPNPARLHRLSTVSFWRAPSRNGYGAPCAFTVDWRRSTILWLPAMSWSQGMFFADSSTNAAYWAQRQRELGADEVMGPRERPKEGTTPAVKRPASAAGSHPQPRLFGTGLPSRAHPDAPGVVVSSIEASVSPSVAIGSAVAKSFRFVGATRIADKRQCRSSRRRSGGPAPGPTYLARQARVPAESDFTTSSLGMFVDGATTPGAQGDGASIR
jgi:hypothetical protein